MPNGMPKENSPRKYEGFVREWCDERHQQMEQWCSERRTECQKEKKEQLKQMRNEMKQIDGNVSILDEKVDGVDQKFNNKFNKILFLMIANLLSIIGGMTGLIIILIKHGILSNQ